MLPFYYCTYLIVIDSNSTICFQHNNSKLSKGPSTLVCYRITKLTPGTIGLTGTLITKSMKVFLWDSIIAIIYTKTLSSVTYHYCNKAKKMLISLSSRKTLKRKTRTSSQKILKWVKIASLVIPSEEFSTKKCKETQNNILHRSRLTSRKYRWKTTGHKLRTLLKTVWRGWARSRT